MGGVDNIRGTAYQQAQAVLAALDVLDDADAGGIRIEGVEDIVDIEMLTKEGIIFSAKQVKTRVEPYVWAKAELTSVMEKWLALPEATFASFEFVTDGRLGASGEEINAALEANKNGDHDKLEALLGGGNDLARRKALSRMSVRVDRATTGALLDRAERQVAAMLDRVRSAGDAREQARGAVDSLYRALFERGGSTEVNVRTFSRSDLAAILGVPVDLPLSRRWDGALRPRYLEAAKSLQDLPPGYAEVQLDPARGDARVDLQALLNESTPVLLFGRTGSGKTTAIRSLRYIGSHQGRVVLLAHAESYLAGRLDALCADAISSLLGEDLPASSGRQALHDRSVTLAIDGVSEVPQELQRALQSDLAALTAAGRGARIILIGRDIAALREALPTSVAPRAYSVSSLDRERRKLLVQRHAALDVEATLFQIDRALGDGAGNPLLFEMALVLAAERKSFSSRAELYSAFVEQLAERAGASGIVVSAIALGIVFARLLDRGRRYSDPYEFSQSLVDASQMLERSYSMDPIAIDACGRRAGLIVPIGHTQTVALIHDSFADYLAGSAHGRGLVSWPPKLQLGDEQRLLFAAEIGGCDPPLAHLVARDLPFLAVRLCAFEKVSVFRETCPSEVETFLKFFLPTGSCCTVALCRMNDRVIAARHVRDMSAWVDEHTFSAIRRDLPVVVLDSGGPLALAVRLWHRYLVDALRKSVVLQPPRPRTREDARVVLIAHFTSVVRATSDLIARVAPPGQSYLLQKTLGPVGMNATILPEEDGDWPVIYRPSEEVEVRLADSAEPILDEPWRSGRTTVTSLIDSTVVGDAAHDVRKAIQSLTRFDWI